MKINGKYYSESEAAAYFNMLLKLLSDCKPILSMAFFADYKLQNKADELQARIDTVIRSERK